MPRRHAPADRVPKAELHAHLEGTIHPPVLRMLAERNGINLPDGVLDADDNYLWTDFNDFLKIYDMAASVIRTPRDYYDLTLDYLGRVAAEGGLYVEIPTSLDMSSIWAWACRTSSTPWSRPSTMPGRSSGSKPGSARPSSGTMVSSAASPPPRRSRPTAPHVTGFQMAGRDGTGWDFRPAYDIAVQAACAARRIRRVARPGVDPRDRGAPMVERLGHGVRAIHDPALVAELAERRIPFEVCPGSNVALSVFESPEQHALRGLWEAGCVITLASDDPPYFHTSLGAEYRFAMDVAGLSVADLFDITRNALNAGSWTRAHGTACCGGWRPRPTPSVWRLALRIAPRFIAPEDDRPRRPT